MDKSVDVSSTVVPSILKLVPDFLLLALLLPSSLALEYDLPTEEPPSDGGELWLSNPGGGERESTTEDFCSITWELGEPTEEESCTL